MSNRSVKSEFDYGSKKKFVDILGTNTQSQLNRLRQEHDIKKGDKQSVLGS